MDCSAAPFRENLKGKVFVEKRFYFLFWRFRFVPVARRCRVLVSRLSVDGMYFCMVLSRVSCFIIVLFWVVVVFVFGCGFCFCASLVGGGLLRPASWSTWSAF